jgi:hypothetical protein
MYVKKRIGCSDIQTSPRLDAMALRISSEHLSTVIPLSTITSDFPNVSPSEVRAF